MIVLGIESSCDETACSLVKDGKEILSSVVRSQYEVHEKLGGVFPELACRKHIDALIPVLKAALSEASVGFKQIDLIAAARGPGLMGALLIGLNAAKALSYAWNVPFVGVNHVEAHLYAAMMPLDVIDWPALGVVISGGHTFLVKIDALGLYTFLGGTQDDAIGEAFDKIAHLLELPYPGGPHIEALAKNGDPSRFAFKPGTVKQHPLDFSFSGLKTHVLYTIKGQNGSKHSPVLLSERERADVAASFQEVALRDVVHKALLAAELQGCKTLFCGGGVSNNQRLRALFAALSPWPVHYPAPGLSLDNAAMIAGLGFHQFQRDHRGDGLDLEPLTRIPLGA